MMERHVLPRAFGLTIVSFFMLAPVAEGQTKAEEIDSVMTRYHESGLFNGTVLVADDGKVVEMRSVRDEARDLGSTNQGCLAGEAPP